MGNKFLLFLFATCFSGIVCGQGFFDKMKDKKSNKKIIKTGPYFGIQSGIFYATTAMIFRDGIRFWVTTLDIGFGKVMLG